MKKELQKSLEKAVLGLKKEENWPDFGMPEMKIENTKNEKFGDLSSNLAMILAGKIQKDPMEIAEKLSSVIESKSLFKNNFEKIEVAKPGYINFYLSQEYFSSLIKEIIEKENHFGDSEIGKREKVNNEFISANPTGPLHLGNGRGGFLGDCLSNILEKCDYDVTREYYVNDAGEQVVKLGHSVLKREDAPYKGKYIDELNKTMGHKDDVTKIGLEASEIILNKYVKETISERMQITFDSWISERNDLLEGGYVKKAIEFLRDKNLTFEKDGAIWLKTTEFGDDKDRVLIKKDKQKTYFASDCGYILHKIERGFNKIIEIWGADHHGYVKRFEAAARALGFQRKLDFILVQLVKLVKDGKEVKMSKREGNVVYIDELIEKVGHDVARFFFLMYSANTHMNFDLGLAQEKSDKNPVYYVQYAYARMNSILRKSKAESLKSKVDYSLLIHEKELNLMREINKFPELVEEIAKSYEVHKLPHYAISLADKFHSFYNDCQVIDEENSELTRARLELVKAVKIVLGETLRLIGVSRPERM